ncbi:hypothetical protein Moror_2100 [Moniliophthora roreri MCA 2997]|uniref:Uncharacterized protein n=2 Tax=Moniliophthora roreri TaxID=221103 RepID=V2XWG0_MONRO|nr:hypothetical protein Moror_2100 [Moniliophthora roreri MCA 2997]
MSSSTTSDDNFGPVINTLTALVKDWLQSLVDSLQTYRHLVGVPPPHPSYPLPADFPFGSLSQVFHWVQIFDDVNQVNRSFRVRMSLFEGRTDRWEPLLWSVHSGNVVLGSVELDRRLYADQSVVSIDPIFILESLIHATTFHRKIVVSSRIVLLAPTSAAPPSASYIWTEIFEIRRSDNNELIKELGRRSTMSQPRFCPTCRVWLPQAGPPYCLQHLP